MDNLTPASIYSTLPNIKVTNSEYLFWYPYWATVRDCLMGEIMVKRRKTQYLPKLETQDPAEYDAYLSRAVFYNATELTVKSIVGSVHIRDPLFDNLPDDLDLMSVTNDGQTFLNFAKQVTYELASVSRYGILVDAPEDGGDAYFAGYRAEDILDWATTRLRGREILRRVILREFVRVDDAASDLPFDSKLVEAIRVLYLDSNGVYRQRYYPEGNIQGGEFVEFVPTKQGQELNYIPFYFFGTKDFGPDVEKPAILDIALLNLSHYRSYAELEAGRHYTAMPVWTVSLQDGGDDDTEFRLGPATVWQLGPNEKAELIEFRGSGLQYLENALNLKEQQIKSLGGKLGQVNRGMAAESSESVISRERGEQSLLQSLISTMSSGMSMLLNELAAWRGINDAGIKVRFTTDMLDIYMSDREIRALKGLWESGLLPLEVLYAVFRDANILPPDMSLQDFKGMLPEVDPLTKQKVRLMREEASINARYAQPNQQPDKQPAD